MTIRINVIQFGSLLSDSAKHFGRLRKDAKSYRVFSLRAKYRLSLPVCDVRAKDLAGKVNCLGPLYSEGFVTSEVFHSPSHTALSFFVATKFGFDGVDKLNK
jgi:hypothetical protein